MVMGEKGPQVGAFYPTAGLVDHWFGVLNDGVFYSELEPFDSVLVTSLKHSWAAVDGRGNECHLRLHCKFPSFTGFLIVLSHEMIHLRQWQWEGFMDHGRSFYSWKDRLREFNLPLHKCN